MKPAVVYSSPTGFISATDSQQTNQQLFALDPLEIKNRFFSPGPVNIFVILDSVDKRLKEYIKRAKSFGAAIAGPPACMKQAPVATQITMWGTTRTFYFQCYESNSWSGNTYVIQFGVKDNMYGWAWE